MSHLHTMPYRKLLVFGLVLGGFYAGAAAAQEQSFSNITCRSGTIAGLAKGENMVAFGLDQRGVTLSQDERKTFDNFTQRCVGSVAIIGGKSMGSGFCRNVDPANGDSTLVQWTSAEKPGTGTFKFLSGTGTWKGISGGGTYQGVAQTRPVDDGTYQNCVHVKGTFVVPKL